MGGTNISNNMASFSNLTAKGNNGRRLTSTGYSSELSIFNFKSNNVNIGNAYTAIRTSMPQQGKRSVFDIIVGYFCK